MHDRIRRGLAVGLVILLTAGCDSAPPPPPSPTPTVQPRATDALKQAAMDALETRCWGKAMPGDGQMTGEAARAVTIAAQMEGSRVKFLGWEYTPTDRVPGGAWLVSFTWTENGIVVPGNSVDFLYRPQTNWIVPANDWADLMMEFCVFTGPD